MLDLVPLLTESHLPEEKWLFVSLRHVAEACKEKQQFPLKFSGCSGCNVPPQEFRIIVVHGLDAVIIRPFHQDPIGVHNKFS